MKKVALGTVLAALISGPVFAYDTGDFIFRSGAITVSPDVSSSALALGSVALDGTAAEVADGTALSLIGTYMLRDHWGLEVIAATPFSHDLEVSGLGETFDLGETKHLPPTVMLQYYPLQASSSVQPYIGLGLNYTAFFDEEVSGEANAVFATLGASGDADLSLKNSTGMAAEAGVDIAFGADQRWLLNLAVWWMDIDTEARVDVPGVGKVAADVELDPLVYSAGFGYRF
ncbi:OmpW family outer membrane protein [uncultured Microbulbifer sp.]|uniref:OmpW/AlkL family protein n=1 Tax=uncultured Microbulbifer sp. TaxID=348147 RepID=UPI0025F1F329|nr:OmpW family outer membrane protein [uncultured Microbulbifer sp.]